MPAVGSTACRCVQTVTLKRFHILEGVVAEGCYSVMRSGVQLFDKACLCAADCDIGFGEYLNLSLYLLA